MDRDKARMRLGRWTLLGHSGNLAREMGMHPRVIRRDLVQRCGPLGGIYTALRTSRAEAELFLACDMPFVPVELLRRLLQQAESSRRAVFVAHRDVSGFPCVIPISALVVVEEQIRQQQWSLQALADVLEARKLVISERRSRQLFNVNSPRDWREAHAIFQQQTRAGRENPRKSRLSGHGAKVMVRA